MSVATPTYDPADAYNAITPQLSSVVLDSTAKGTQANNAQNFLWNAYPWRWTRKILPDITLVDDTQDYSGANVPTDFLQLLQVSCVRTDTTPDHVWELDIKPWLPLDPQSKQFPLRQVAFLHELNSQAGGFRVLPNPGISSGVTAVIRGTYKFKPSVTYTSANLTTNFAELPDSYFYVYEEVLRWMLFRYVGDKRAGSTLIDGRGNKQYTGQMGVMMEAIKTAMLTEDLPDSDTIFPEDPLGFTRDVRGVAFP